MDQRTVREFVKQVHRLHYFSQKEQEQNGHASPYIITEKLRSKQKVDELLPLMAEYFDLPDLTKPQNKAA